MEREKFIYNFLSYVVDLQVKNKLSTDQCILSTRIYTIAKFAIRIRAATASDGCDVRVFFLISARLPTCVRLSRSVQLLEKFARLELDQQHELDGAFVRDVR